jgi:septal ring factor EnvC (AmiA/AmiB activator)
MKEKQDPEIVYALADYKQLVLAYKTKHAQLVSALSFWKASFFWLMVLSASVIGALVLVFSDARTALSQARKEKNALDTKAAALKQQQDEARARLDSTREELQKKEAVIRELEKSLSTASKKLLERLLKEQVAPAGRE